VKDLRRFFVIGISAAIFGPASVVAQQQPQIDPSMLKQIQRSTLHDVHAAGKVMSVGKATGDDNKPHMLVGIRLDQPLSGGVTIVTATVTHNEPPQSVQTGLGIHSGHVKVVDSVDVTCPVVNVMTVRTTTSAFGEECTFNSYTGPIS
jgi:hypothetical protein